MQCISVLDGITAVNSTTAFLSYACGMAKHIKLSIDLREDPFQLSNHDLRRHDHWLSLYDSPLAHPIYTDDTYSMVYCYAL